jgi:hypothetical protein
MRTPMPWKQSVASLILRTTECCWRQGPSTSIIKPGILACTNLAVPCPAQPESGGRMI